MTGIIKLLKSIKYDLYDEYKKKMFIFDNSLKV